MKPGGLDAARQCYIRRQLGKEHPDGQWLAFNGDYLFVEKNHVIDYFIDNAADYHVELSTDQIQNVFGIRLGRFGRLHRHLWEPIGEERLACCQRVIDNNSTIYSTWIHCLGSLHIGRLYGVDPDEVFQAQHAVEMIKKLGKTRDMSEDTA